MRQAEMRKWHRRMGLALAFFLVLQGLTGLIYSVGYLVNGGDEHKAEKALAAAKSVVTGEEHEDALDEAMDFIHHGGGVPGAVYRILLGLGLVGQAMGGVWIFMDMRKRAARR